MLDARLLPTVMNLVASQPTELSIQEHGLSLLARLALLDHDGARAGIATDGGGLALTAADALRSFPGSAVVQQGGVGSSRNGRFCKFKILFFYFFYFFTFLIFLLLGPRRRDDA